MLPKPSILKIPDASTALTGGLNGCNSGYSKSDGTKCNSGYNCNPVSSGTCIDVTYSSGCSWTLGIGIGGAAVGVGVTAGIAIT